jgi:GAF domain-containing protein
VIGALAIQQDAENPLSPEDLRLVESITDQIALAMESARLFEQTQLALTETETLYEIIAEMNAADDYDDILNAVVERSQLSAARTTLLCLFDRPVTARQTADWVLPVANTSEDTIEIAERYPVSAFEAEPGVLFGSEVIVLDDLEKDARVDRVARTLFRDVFGASSAVFVPLSLADQVIGFLAGFFETYRESPADEAQRLAAVGGQAAIAVQSLRLLGDAQARARQEERIRAVSAEVFSAADVDAIMRRAVEQVGRVLGKPAYIYLGQEEQKEEE